MSVARDQGPHRNPDKCKNSSPVHKRHVCVITKVIKTIEAINTLVSARARSYVGQKKTIVRLSMPIYILFCLLFYILLLYIITFLSFQDYIRVSDCYSIKHII